MSENIPPTVELLVKELNIVTDWYVFGVALGVPVSTLNCIKSENSDVENKKIQMFQFWLQYKLDASWKLVIQALEQNNYLVLAATLSKKYLLSDSSNTTEEEREGSVTTEVNESIAEIRATAAVVERLRDLETSFTKMLTNLLRLLTECKCDLSEAQFFLDDQFDTEKFNKCPNFNSLLRELRKGHVDTFNTYYLQELVAYFKKDQLTERFKEYEAEKEDFLKDTTVIEFQRAVVSRVEPVKPSQMKDLTIKISKKLAKDRTLKDMEELALRAFGEYQLEFVRIHVKLGSVIILVFFPETLTGKLEYLAHKNAAVFKDAGVEEVSVGGRVVFPSTLEEELKDTPTASLKEVYIDFYHRLVEAVSDEHTCHCLLTSSALISEKIAQLTSSRATGSLFLKTLKLEEEPRLLVPLVSAMSGVEQLQTLAGEISATMRSNQAKAIIQDTERQPNLDGKERQQLVADNERLTSDKADLLTRLHCCEEELKIANELLRLREKAISGMMAAVRRRDADMEEREERICHLEKEFEELRRKGVEKESLLTIEIEDLKSQLMTKTDEAIKSNSEVQQEKEDEGGYVPSEEIKRLEYSIPELNMPHKYQDPFESQPTFTDDEDSGEGMGHEFDYVSVPHNKPQYCDHCDQTAWGHHQVLKCTKCEFICHKKCKNRIFLKCNSKTDTEVVLQQDRTCEDLEETIELPPADKGKQPNHTNSSSSLDASQHLLLGSMSGSSHVMSERALLEKKIREYNRKTTPVNHIHIKPRDALIDYQGFVRVHMCIQRPIHVSTGVTRTSWYRLMRPVKERSIDSGIDAGLETAFYLPTDTNRLVHISNVTSTRDLVNILLKKFCITDNPKKFSLYEEYGSDCRRLFDDYHPLTVVLDSSVAGRNSKLVLRDNLCSTIQWDAFTLPELNNFVAILKREEEIYASRLRDHFKMWKKVIGDISEEQDGELNGSSHPLAVVQHAPQINVEPIK